MKDVAFSMWKWIAVAVLAGAVGIMLLLGLGRRRGTRTYRWRMSLWALALSLLGGSAMVGTGCDEMFEAKSACYITVDIVDAGSEPDSKPDATLQEVQATCYKQWVPEDMVPQPDAGPDIQVLCYGPMPSDITNQPDSQPNDTQAPPDAIIMCYDPMPPDIESEPPPDVVEPDVQIMCYEDIPTDIKEHPKDVPDYPDLVMTCYFAGDFPEEEE
jgi:hypothetical protein